MTIVSNKKIINEIEYMSLSSLLEEIGNIDTSEHKSQTPVPVKGLPNLGNTCYLNSVLQILFNTQKLTEYLNNRTVCLKILEYNKDYKNIMVTATFYRLFIARQLQGKSEVNHWIRSFKKVFGEHFRDQFYGFRQNDQHECMNYLLNVLHDGFGVKHNMIITGNVTSVIDELEQKSLSNFRSQTLSGWRIESDKSIVYPSIISDLFGGQFHERTECINCNHVSSVFSSFKVMQMPFPTGKDLDVNSFINYFTSITQLSESEKYHCDRCNKDIRARRRITIWKKPRVLLMSLKRFICTMNPLRIYKINHGIIPNRVIDITNHTSRRTSDMHKYRLYSLGIHSGGINGGHCVTEALIAKDDSWELFDDLSCKKITELSRNSYLIGYDLML